MLYGQYAEKYVHTETFLRDQDKMQLSEGCRQLSRVAVSNGAECLEAEKNTDTGSYDVTRVWSVLFWQTVYVAGVPLMMVMMMMMMMMLMMICSVEGDRSGGPVSGHS